MNFSEALEQIKQLKAVQRSGWNGPNQWVTIMNGATVGCVELEPFLVIRTAQGDHIPWLASQSDLLADDWRVETRQRVKKHPKKGKTKMTTLEEKEQMKKIDGAKRTFKVLGNTEIPNNRLGDKPFEELTPGDLFVSYDGFELNNNNGAFIYLVLEPPCMCNNIPSLKAHPLRLSDLRKRLGEIEDVDRIKETKKVVTFFTHDKKGRIFNILKNLEINEGENIKIGTTAFEDLRNGDVFQVFDDGKLVSEGDNSLWIATGDIYWTDPNTPMIDAEAYYQ